MDKFNNAEKVVAPTQMGNALIFFLLLRLCVSGESNASATTKSVAKRLQWRAVFSAIKPIIWHLLWGAPLAFVHSTREWKRKNWRTIFYWHVQPISPPEFDWVFATFRPQICHVYLVFCISTMQSKANQEKMRPIPCRIYEWWERTKEKKAWFGAVEGQTWMKMANCDCSRYFSAVFLAQFQMFNRTIHHRIIFIGVTARTAYKC